ncbi:MAG: hypothetical protein Q9218_002202 [Villophora microphyllina]
MSAQVLSAAFSPAGVFTHGSPCLAGVGNADVVVHGPKDLCDIPRGGSSYHACPSTMLGEAGPYPMLASSTSSMSNFDNSVENQGSRGPEVRTKGILKSPPETYVRQHSQNSSVSSQLFRRDSASTFESAESSPTTTVSTMDSALTEPSPSSSPESATSMLPIASFKSLSTTSIADPLASPFPTLPGVHRADSPNKKMRNMKNLSVNTSASARQAPQLPKLSLRADSKAPNHAFSAPPTPSFIVPPKPPKKRPSNLGLTIFTPESSASTQATDNTTPAVPSTPADPQPRTIRYLQAASSTHSVSSPTVAPEGGMRLPPFGNASIPTRPNKMRPPLSLSRHSSVDSQASPIRVQMLEHVQEEPDYDLPLSREAKSPAYPQGPVCIYDPHVYLYLEPSHTEASDFDVVLNVAREVKNPFTLMEEKIAASTVVAQNGTSSEPRPDAFDTRDDITGPQSTSTGKISSFTENGPDEGFHNVSSTPKALKPKPEYIHVPWDHNTNLVDDLLALCKLIDQRVQDGKRVLVHCQCGVSRSASLVVAYGLFKSPELSVQEAYDAVKNRSKWIGPNMNLIYQLNEFRSKLPKSTEPSFSNWQGWKAAGGGRLNTSNVSATGSRPGVLASSQRNSYQDSTITSSRRDLDSTPVRANSFSPPGSALFGQKSTPEAVSPGPSSAPPNVQWSPSKEVDESRADEVIQLEPERMPDTAIRIQDGPKANEDPESKHQISFTVAKSTLDMIEPAIAQPFSRETVQAVDDDAATSPPPPPSSSPKPLPGGFSSIPTRKQAPRPLAFRQLPQAEIDRTVVDDVPKTPSILSPRAAEFTASPFHRTTAGDLAGSSVFEQSVGAPRRLSYDEDPRSPVQKGDAGTTRNIFDVL